MAVYLSGAKQHCILATVKTSKTSILEWGLMSYNGVGPRITVEGSVTGTKYRQILQKNLSPLIAERRRKGL